MINYFYIYSKNGQEKHFIKKWHIELQDPTRSTTYIYFSNLNFQFYLDNAQNTKNQNVLSRL